jgi:hypothetical protein
MPDIIIYNPEGLAQPLGQYSHVTRVKASDYHAADDRPAGAGAVPGRGADRGGDLKRTENVAVIPGRRKARTRNPAQRTLFASLDSGSPPLRVEDARWRRPE